jgi:UDP-2,3-diacylglucosamine hydrolase
MRENCYFLSDLHLGSAQEPNAFVLLQFLRQFQSTEQISHLFLVGDIFDLWVSSQDYYIKKFQPIVDEWRRLHAFGVKIHYFEGNHDLYLQHYFGNVLGFEIHTGPTYFEHGGYRIRVEHGDQMDLTDHGYHLLRWFWRTPVMNWLAPRIPTAAVRAVGENMSRASRAHNQRSVMHGAFDTDRAYTLMQQHVMRIWPADPFDILVCGHIHVRQDFQITMGQKSVRAVNLGSWFDGPKAFHLSDHNASFVDIVPATNQR